MAAELHELLVTDYDIVEVVQDGAALIEAEGGNGLTPSFAISACRGQRTTAAASILATRPDARIVS